MASNQTIEIPDKYHQINEVLSIEIRWIDFMSFLRPKTIGRVFRPSLVSLTISLRSPLKLRMANTRPTKKANGFKKPIIPAHKK